MENAYVHALLCESMRALIFPSRISCISSSSRADTDVLNASAIFRMSADKYGLKYCQTHNNKHDNNTRTKRATLKASAACHEAEYFHSNNLYWPFDSISRNSKATQAAQVSHNPHLKIAVIRGKRMR